jgi:hypothetical protein
MKFVTTAAETAMAAIVFRSGSLRPGNLGGVDSAVAMRQHSSSGSRHLNVAATRSRLLERLNIITVLKAADSTAGRAQASKVFR